MSDYGTANFMPLTKTIGPGAMIYSSPKALTPNQTAKVKIMLSLVVKTVRCLL